MGASQATFGDLFTSMSEIHGALLASGGAVLGSAFGTEVKLDGHRGKFRIRYDGTETSFIADNQRKLAFNQTSSRFHGTWNFDQPSIHLTMARRRIPGSPSPPSPSASLILDNGSSQGIVSYGQDSKMLFTAGGTKFISAQSTGAILHGKWSAEDVIMVSDKRLKNRIQSLRVPNADSKKSLDAASWTLRELRPVSFYFKKTSESKAQESSQLRYGFIANEVEKVAPTLVRDIGQDLKGIAYLDLIALAIAAQQAQQEATEKMSERIRPLEKLQAQVEALEMKNEALEVKVENLRKYIEAHVGARTAGSSPPKRRPTKSLILVTVQIRQPHYICDRPPVIEPRTRQSSEK
eukprot:gnl/MRDRNA2_/MRDRNA2_76069_c0_seq1.p1 gnl/MRDRNA2_/MRDRNA2_76069_c0~~gnl/MRDRNA2_/MRDRNA2_76069_c0_seq1.p1  ORF type:complete len:388 (+),score=63.25 gnl/MRDRNA2_/MRDRNA2_76069_c0_seq1:115-1164(+)